MIQEKFLLLSKNRAFSETMPRVDFAAVFSFQVRGMKQSREYRDAFGVFLVSCFLKGPPFVIGFERFIW